MGNTGRVLTEQNESVAMQTFSGLDLTKRIGPEAQTDIDGMTAAAKRCWNYQR